MERLETMPIDEEAGVDARVGRTGAAAVDPYRALFDTMLQGCFHGRILFEGGVPVDWEYLAVNQAYERLTGFHDVAGKRASAFMPSNGRVAAAEARAVYAEVARTGEPARFEIHMPAFGRWMSIGVHRPAPGEFVAVFEDVTERRLAEERLRESEARFRAIFEESGVGVVQVDAASGRFVLANEKFCEIIGYPREEVLALAWMDVIHPEELAEDLQHSARLASGEVLTSAWETRLVRKDGGVIWVHLTASRMSEEGRSAFGVATITDITARKMAEEALREAQGELCALTADLERRVAERTAELARAARAKDEFLASMSHELRTPLNGILGVTEALVEEVYGPLNERQEGALGRVGESGRHLLSLINDILDVAKVEAGKIELCPGPLDIAELCRASLRLVAEPARRKGLVVEANLPFCVRVEADERRLKQVLVNLLTNAVKFTPEGGRIGIDVSAPEGGEALDVAVWDTGIGIPDADLPRLFQPFVQLDSRLSRQHAGTGLGLALVRRLVDLHGGSVRVESAVGRGSRFILTLPLAAPAESAAPSSAQVPSSARPSGAVEGALVLVADDDENNRALLRDVLQHRGYGVCEAQDGYDAVATAQARRPSLILMDIQMPNLDGLGAIRAIRAAPEVADTPVIALTALAMPGDEDRCLAAGADAYLSKPIAVQKLLAAMGRLAVRPGGRAAP
jgi:PAS domain S-box-containing protein